MVSVTLMVFATQENMSRPPACSRPSLSSLETKRMVSNKALVFVPPSPPRLGFIGASHIRTRRGTTGACLKPMLPYTTIFAGMSTTCRLLLSVLGQEGLRPRIVERIPRQAYLSKNLRRARKQRGLDGIYNGVSVARAGVRVGVGVQHSSVVPYT